MPTYTGISSEAFRHPLDQQARQALRSLPDFDLVPVDSAKFVYERPSSSYLIGQRHSIETATIFHLPVFRECVRKFRHSPKEPAVRIPKSAS